MGKLILARHHESEWNKLGKWTGKRDRHLDQYGFDKSEDMGLLIKDMTIEYAFASMLVRSIETLSSMLTVLKLYNVPSEYSAALNERDYGDYPYDYAYEGVGQIFQTCEQTDDQIIIKNPVLYWDWMVYHKVPGISDHDYEERKERFEKTYINPLNT